MYVGEGNCEDFFECDMHALKLTLPPQCCTQVSSSPSASHTVSSVCTTYRPGDRGTSAPGNNNLMDQGMLYWPNK